MTKNNSLVLTIDKLTGFAYNVSSDNFLFLSSQDSLNVFENVFAQVKQYLSSNSQYGKSLMQKSKTGFHPTEMRHRKAVVQSKFVR
jgi:hypothetical protein